LATYAEVRAAIGANETGGTDAADGTTVWLIYSQNPASSRSAPSWYAIVDAVTGNPIEGGSEEQIDGKASPASVAWIAQVHDHQYIGPCTASSAASPSTPGRSPRGWTECGHSEVCPV